jgi:hypothetical protein
LRRKSPRLKTRATRTTTGGRRDFNKANPSLHQHFMAMEVEREIEVKIEVKIIDEFRVME